MGLHERATVSESPSPEEVERQSVLWVLYSVDKQRVFIRGPPCRIYLFECHVQLPRGDDPRERLISVNLRLVCLVEGIYKHLYSPKASRQEARIRQKIALRLENRLDKLASELENALAPVECSSNVETTMRLQLEYALHVTRLLIHGKIVGPSEESQLTTARKALGVIQKLAEGNFIFSGYIAVLERLVPAHMKYEIFLRDSGYFVAIL